MIRDHGSLVPKGEIVALVDVSEELAKLPKLENEVAAKKTELQNKEREYEVVDQETRNESELRVARARAARIEQDAVLARPDAEELKLLEIERELSATSHREAVAERERQQRLMEAGFLSELGLAPFLRREEAAREAWIEAGLRIDIAKKGPTEERRAQLRTALERAEAELERAGKSRQRRIAEISQALDAARKAVAVAEAELENGRRLAAQGEVFAPAAGHVSLRTFRDWQNGGQISRYAPGAPVEQSDVIGTVVEPGRLRVEILVNEVDLVRLVAGQTATITLPALPGLRLKAEVERVGQAGQDRNFYQPGSEGAETGVSLHSVELKLRDMPLELRPGMTADCEVVVDPPRPRLLASRAAVEGSSEEGWRVRRRAAVGWEEVEVKGYPVDELDFYFASGVQEGDVLRLP
jgi:multidrug resistance efflux pump